MHIHVICTLYTYIVDSVVQYIYIYILNIIYIHCACITDVPYVKDVSIWYIFKLHFVVRLLPSILGPSKYIETGNILSKHQWLIDMAYRAAHSNDDKTRRWKLCHLQEIRWIQPRKLTCPLKISYFNRKYIWTNHWFSPDMLVFLGVPNKHDDIFLSWFRLT